MIKEQEKHSEYEIARSIGDAYYHLKPELIIDRLSSDCIWESMFVDYKRTGIDVIRKYYQQLFSNIQLGNIDYYRIVNLIKKKDPYPNIFEPLNTSVLDHYEANHLAVYMEQKINHGWENNLVCFQFNQQGNISRILIADPRFFETELYRIPWGGGMVEYQRNDCLTEQEIHDFGMESILPYLEKEGYHILDALGRMSAIPNIFATKDGRRVGIYCQTAVAPIQPQISQEDKERLLYYPQHSTKPDIPLVYYASVSIGSCDEERFKHSIALVTDDYYINYEGLQKIE